jgi:hypothetical protein
MEFLVHVLVGYFIALVRRLNRRSQKPLCQVIADFNALRTDPEHVLEKQPVHIGRGRRFGSILAVSLFGTMALWAASCAGLIAALDQVAPPAPGQIAVRAIPFLALLIAPLVSALGARRFFNGRSAQASLHRHGVVLSSGRENVFCPWQLFDTAGSPVRVHPDRVIVPVASEAVPLIVVQKNGRLVEQEPVRTRSLSCRPGNQIVLSELYEVDVLELAHLFLFLGRRLGPANAEAPSASATVGQPGVPSAVVWRAKMAGSACLSAVLAFFRAAAAAVAK